MSGLLRDNQIVQLFVLMCVIIFVISTAKYTQQTMDEGHNTESVLIVTTTPDPFPIQTTSASTEYTALPTIHKRNVDAADGEFEQLTVESIVVQPALADNTLVHHRVPFMPQAPFAEWDDMRQDYGCEEASILMAWHWLQEIPLTAQLMKDGILDIVEWETITIGEYLDTSAADTTRIFKEYIGHENIELVYDISIDDMKTALAAGNILLVPVNGQALENPYFSPPGPVHHMFVVVGYDDANGYFIVNDPGTRRGEAIHYSYDIMQQSLRDYDTGHHAPVEVDRTAMIIVKP